MQSTPTGGLKDLEIVRGEPDPTVDLVRGPGGAGGSHLEWNGPSGGRCVGPACCRPKPYGSSPGSTGGETSLGHEPLKAARFPGSCGHCITGERPSPARDVSSGP